VQAVRTNRRQTNDTAPFDALAPTQAPNERRSTFQAMTAWAALAMEDGMPELRDLLRQHRGITRQEFLLKADLIPRFSVFILCGDTVSTLLGKTVRGATLWECMPQPVRNTLSEACATALKLGAPVQEEGGFEIHDGAAIRYRSVFLPLRSSGYDDPSYLFGAYGSRAFGAAAPAAA
jgi:hypothetical protein